MVAVHPVVESPEEAAAALAAADGSPGLVLQVPVVDEVPSWMADVVAQAHDAGARVSVALVGPMSRGAEARAGWEIGALTASFLAGVDEASGAAPARISRVRAVVEELGS